MYNPNYNIWSLVDDCCCENRFDAIYRVIEQLDLENLRELECELPFYSGRPLHTQIQIRINIRRERLEKQNESR